MKRLISLFLTLALLCPVLPVRADGSPSVSASSAILMEAGEGRVVWEKEADTRRPMASTTKIMTALLALESGRLGETVKVPAEAVGVEGSSLYLEEGDETTLEALVWALLLESANDAAAAIACVIAGSEEAFAGQMNERAASLGLNGTHFTNPHGLSDDDHYTTARDLAQLACAAMKNERFREIVSTYRADVTVGGETRRLLNHNKMLRLYDGACGVKTGYTKKSGRCLVSAAKRDGLTMVAVTLDAPDDWNDHAALLDLGFSTLERRTLVQADECTFIQPCIGSEKGDITVRNPEGLSVLLPKGRHDVTRRIILPRYFFAPVKTGDEVGRIEFYEGTLLLGSVKLTAAEDADRVIYRRGLFDRLFGG